MTVFRNLTPHTIRVIDAGNVLHSLPADPQGPARVSSRSVERAPISRGFYDPASNEYTPTPEWGTVEETLFKVSAVEYGTVENLPESQPGVVLIVSALVLARCAGRADVVAPDTGPTAERIDGQVFAVRGFITN